mmetsp:Transcript_35810/g.86440  ORF Transcript_35810/g.86440 Transcript_35810/m.86440 type:complete len:441 (-) Transcript_35810:1578-2900(-)
MRSRSPSSSSSTPISSCHCPRDDDVARRGDMDRRRRRRRRPRSNILPASPSSAMTPSSCLAIWMLCGISRESGGGGITAARGLADGRREGAAVARLGSSIVDRRLPGWGFDDPQAEDNGGDEADERGTSKTAGGGSAGGGGYGDYGAYTAAGYGGGAGGGGAGQNDPETAGGGKAGGGSYSTTSSYGSYGGGGADSSAAGGAAGAGYGGGESSNGGGASSYGEGSSSYGTGSGTSSYGGGTSSYGGGASSYGDGGSSYETTGSLGSTTAYGSASSESSFGGSYAGGYSDEWGAGAGASSEAADSRSQFEARFAKLGGIASFKLSLLPALILLILSSLGGMLLTAHRMEHDPEGTYANCCRVSLHTVSCIYGVMYNLYHCRLGDIPQVVFASELEQEEEYTDEEIERMRLRPGIERALDVEHRKALRKVGIEMNKIKVATK